MDNNYETEEDSEEEDDSRGTKKRKVYPPIVKEAIWNALEASKVDNLYPQDAFLDISKQQSVNWRMVENVCNQGMVHVALDDINFVDWQKSIGRALKYNPVELKAHLSQLPIESRGTVCTVLDFTHGLDMPSSTFFKYTKIH
jgi:hypothetical protein